MTEDEECPFSYPEGEEPDEPVHTVVGDCFHCGDLAYTFDTEGRFSCWPCAYSDAS